MDSSKLPITGPCPIDLDAIGYDRGSKVGHCGHCDKSVHNLSTMTEKDARAFLRERAGEKICVTYARDPDGVVQFRTARKPDVVPLARLRRSATAAAGVGLAAALAACTPHDGGREHVVGEMRAPNPVEVPAGGMVAPELEDDPEPEPCEKGKQDDDREPLEMVEGEIEAPPPVPAAGGMQVPEPEMLDGELEVPEHEREGADGPGVEG